MRLGRTLLAAPRRHRRAARRDEMRGALMRVARHVAASEAAAWWTSPVDVSSQHTMLWDGDDPVPPVDRERTSLLAARQHVEDAGHSAGDGSRSTSRVVVAEMARRLPSHCSPRAGRQPPRRTARGGQPGLGGRRIDRAGRPRRPADLRDRVGGRVGRPLSPISGRRVGAEAGRLVLDHRPRRRLGDARLGGRRGRLRRRAPAGGGVPRHRRPGDTGVGRGASVVAGWDPDQLLAHRPRAIHRRTRTVGREGGTRPLAWERAEPLT